MTKKSRSPYLIAFILFVCGISYMVYSGISQNSLYFLNVSEALAMEREKIGAARLFGMVSENNIIYDNDGLTVRFQIVDATNSQSDLAKYASETNTEGGASYPKSDKPLINKHGKDYIDVQFKGTVPDTFDAGVEVIIEGVMQEDGFIAKTLMTKCPSKYEKEDIRDMPAQI